MNSIDLLYWFELGLAMVSFFLEIFTQDIFFTFLAFTNLLVAFGLGMLGASLEWRNIE